MRKGLKGSLTIEASFLVPLILFVFGVLLHMLFYYHDKNVIAGIAYETGVYAAGRQEVDEAEAERHFQSRVKGRLLLFDTVKSEIHMEEKQVQIVCRAKRNAMSLRSECTMSRTEPEDYIRSIRKLEKLQKGLGKTK